MHSSQVKSWISQYREEILAMNRKFVSLRSENLYPNGLELHAQLAFNDLLQTLGFQTDVFLVTDVPGIQEHEAFLNEGRIYAGRPNVVGKMSGAGGGRSLLFSGHMDTVPIGSDPWSKNPLGGEIEDNRQYGVGILDMKAGMVAAAMAAKCIQDLNIRLKGDLLIESVVDEEYGGANGTLACRLRGYEADIAIVPEPTNMAICPAAQGGSYFRITFQGKPGRTYSGEKLVNPVYPAARFIEIVRQYHEWRNHNTPVHPLYRNNPELPTLLEVMRAGEVDIDLGDRIPSSCSFDVWVQCYPGTSEQELYEEFMGFYREKAKDDELLQAMPPRIEKKLRFLHATTCDTGHPMLEVLTDASRRVLGKDLPVQGAPFACDSFIFNKYSNTPAIIFGPSGSGAHSVDEHIYIDEFLQLIEIYTMTILDWCGVDK